MSWTRVTELSADPTIYAQQIAENMRLSQASAAGKLARAGKPAGPAAKIVSIDPLAAYIAAKQAEMVEKLKAEYLADHPEAALPAALQAMTGKELQAYITSEQAKLTTYAAAAIKMCERDDKRAADKAAADKAAADKAAADAQAEAARIKAIEEMNAVLAAKKTVQPHQNNRH
jgi:colicin import membrane protein